MLLLSKQYLHPALGFHRENPLSCHAAPFNLITMKFPQNPFFGGFRHNGPNFQDCMGKGGGGGNPQPAGYPPHQPAITCCGFPYNYNPSDLSCLQLKPRRSLKKTLKTPFQLFLDFFVSKYPFRQLLMWTQTPHPQKAKTIFLRG